LGSCIIIANYFKYIHLQTLISLNFYIYELVITKLPFLGNFPVILSTLYCLNYVLTAKLILNEIYEIYSEENGTNNYFTIFNSKNS
jgi:hypothetical protein